MQRSSVISDNQLADWHTLANRVQDNINNHILGQSHVVKLLTIAIFCRGHVLLEGDVGVGKTTLLRIAAESLGGDFERIEGTIDLMPHDLIYYTHIDEHGKPAVGKGPLLKHGEDLSIFFFNEINRAKPQVHAMLLRIMAEKSLSAFNQSFHFPYLQVFADRNRIERDETFELPAAARDRFMMELHIAQPSAEDQLKMLMFDTRFYNSDSLVDEAQKAIVPYRELNQIAAQIQQHIHASPAIQDYGFRLCQALRNPGQANIQLSDIDTEHLIAGGMGPRGIAFLARAARANAWLAQRDCLTPEDFHAVLPVIAKHRLFVTPAYQYAAEQLVEALIEKVLAHIPAP
ncbi:moxR-like ATPase [Methylophaga lonarensis MPL]|uniref:MoxR-like ATPase n=1 Tax=Methylophaga lonarensis MPL TaxID=1286106 RepID=M7PN47_9GAMM|nr:MoxR family ATPase [Methylophaga lonarensis]EMR11884.1 moxR-like ATPase [Methylophaga lonarensis MPL]